MRAQNPKPVNCSKKKGQREEAQTERHIDKNDWGGGDIQKQKPPFNPI